MFHETYLLSLRCQRSKTHLKAYKNSMCHALNQDRLWTAGGKSPSHFRKQKLNLDRCTHISIGEDLTDYGVESTLTSHRNSRLITMAIVDTLRFSLMENQTILVRWGSSHRRGRFSAFWHFKIQPTWSGLKILLHLWLRKLEIYRMWWKCLIIAQKQRIKTSVCLPVQHLL